MIVKAALEANLKAWLVTSIVSCLSMNPLFAIGGSQPVLQPGSGLSATQMPQQLEGVGVDEKLGQQIDLSLTFIAENGYPVPLQTFFDGKKPVILTLVYYDCPMLCNLILNGLVQGLRDIPWEPGRDFEIVSISFDPRETFALAQKKRLLYLNSYGKERGWHFLVDHQGNVKKLAEQVGFHYRWDEKREQFAHPSVIMVLMPDGRVARYLYGIEFKPMDLRLALTEASQFHWSKTVDRILLFCYHYDPKEGSYVLFAYNLMRAAGLLTVIVLGFILWRFFKTEKQSQISVTTASQEQH